jgi:hypothetical protein
MMFGKPILKVTDKGWLKSSACFFFFHKVSKILAAMASAFSRRVDASLSREFCNINPFDEKIAFQEVIAKHAHGRGFVWHTVASIGTCQWLIVAGRFDLCYAISSLSQFSAAPLQDHLKHARRIMGYLRKFPQRGYVIN